MGRYSTAALTISLILPAVLPAAIAGEVSGEGRLQLLAKHLVLWIGAHTDYDVSRIPLPNIVEMSPKDLTTEAYSDNPKQIPKSGIDDRVIALYSFEDGANGTIYILAARYADDGAAPGDPPENNPIFQERLLHELVHHVQRISGAYETFPCRNFGEHEAYELGGKFLKANHTADPLPNRVFWSRIYSRC